MADPNALSQPLQESVLTLLVFGGDKGQVASGLVTAKHFEPPYATIADKAIAYRQRYRTAPGKEHIDDLFDHILGDPTNKQEPLFRRILFALVRQAEHLNEEYTLNRVTEFIKRQTYKRLILKGAERIQRGGEAVNEDLEKVFIEGARFQADTLAPGTFLGDAPKALSFLDERDNESLMLDIKELDDAGIVPTRKELLIFMAPRKRGKSMFVTYCAKQAFLANWKFLDITLEMSEERKAQRFFQAMEGIAKRSTPYVRTELDINEQGHLIGFTPEKVVPKIALDMPREHVRRFIQGRMAEWGIQLDNLVIKQFPTGTLTIPKLIAYLDMMENVHGFVPDCISIDYPWLMWKDPRDYRISFGQTLEQFRGLLVERNMAGIAPHQSTRSGERSRQLKGDQVAEDISVMATADNLITRTATDEEQTLGLGRLYVGAARNDRGGFSFLHTHDFNTGQFCIQTAPQLSNYWDLFKAHAGLPDDAKDDSEVDDGTPQSFRPKPKRIKY